jgi:excisionase family DNA binding protein
MADTELLTVSQAADALNASTQTVRNWIRADRPHGVRIGNRFLIPRAEVDQMRGGLSAPRGESPWDFDDDEAAAPLPRARALGLGDDSAESLFGG